MGRHEQASASGHGVAGVDGQVDDGLLQVVGVGANGIERIGQAQLEFDILADQAAEHFFGAGDDVVDIDHGGLHHLAAAEGQQLAGDGSGAVGGFKGFFKVAAQFGASRQVIQNHPAIAADDGQHVVEVVGHATRQPAHRFHLLGVHQLLLQGLALADVGHEGNAEDALRTFDETEADLNRKLAAILAAAGQIHPDSHRPRVRLIEIGAALALVRRTAGLRQQQLKARPQ